jgi:TRAP-type mannitol/chloroaromatic compound transport system permease small subunit
MGNTLSWGATALAAAAIFMPLPVSHVMIAAAFVMVLAGGFMGARGALALAALVFVVAVFQVSPDGASHYLRENFDINTRRFWRSYSELVAFVLGVTICAIYVIWARRSAEGWPRYVVDTTKDLDAIVVGIGRLAAWLFVPMMLIIFYDISQRKIIDWDNDFVNSIFFLDSNKLQELEWHLHGTLFLLCLGYAYVKDAHVRIELVRDRMQARTRVWMELIGIVCFLLTYSYLIAEFGYVFAERSYKIGEVSAAQTGLTHRWIIKGMMPVGFMLLFAAGLSASFKCMVYLFGPADLQREVDEYAGTHHADLPEDLLASAPDGAKAAPVKASIAKAD